MQNFSPKSALKLLIFTGGLCILPLCIFPMMGMGGLAIAGEKPNVEGFKNYKIDTAHSQVAFEISHLVIATVEGRFATFNGTFAYNAATRVLKDSMIEIDTASIDTNEVDRDKHLRGPDFFDTAKFPKITFNNPKLSVENDKPVFVDGMLTMHGITKPVKLAVDFKGFVTDPWKNNKIVFNLNGKVSRKDYGLVWNKSLDSGGLMIGDDVIIKIRVEANQL